MARVEYSDPAKHSERTRELLGKNRNANIFRMMAHSPSYLEQYCRLGGAIRHKGELDPIVRELAITRTGILCESPYEIVAHKRIGKNVGVTDAALPMRCCRRSFGRLSGSAPTVSMPRWMPVGSCSYSRFPPASKPIC